MPPALKLEKGYKSGDLTVISSPISVIQKNGRNRGYKHICMCKCGKRTYKLATDLRRGKVKSCRECANLLLEKSVTSGNVFGKLTVVSNIPKKRIQGIKNKYSISTYKCRCECGVEAYFTLKHIFGGNPKMCKVCAIENRPQSKYFSPYARLYRVSLNKSKSRKRKITNNLTLEEFTSIVSKNCHYCDSPPSEKKFLSSAKVIRRDIVYANGIDRVNSNEGYSVKNCVPCCSWCNVMKSNRSVEDFYYHINKILKFKNQKT